MLSGKGRHRRPRQAPALFVTAGVTGAGLALPLLGASGVQAADGATWDRVAECESDGVWSADTGNGFFGGLQLPLSTWESYGGTEYAKRPDLASRSQQIAVAERVLAAKGAEAWPACGVDGGLPPASMLDERPEKPERPDGTDDPSDPGQDAPGKGNASKSPEPGDTSTGDESPGDRTDPDPSASPGGGKKDDGDRGGSRTDRSRPDSDATPKADPSERERPPDGGSDGSAEDSGKGKSPDREGELGDTAHGYDPGGPTGPWGGDVGERPSRGDGDRDGRYRVQPGDNLSSIAEHEGVRGGWPALYEANHRQVGEDPDLILPGQLLQVDGRD